MGEKKKYIYIDIDIDIYRYHANHGHKKARVAMISGNKKYQNNTFKIKVLLGIDRDNL